MRNDLRSVSEAKERAENLLLDGKGGGNQVFVSQEMEELKLLVQVGREEGREDECMYLCIDVCLFVCIYVSISVSVYVSLISVHVMSNGVEF